MGARNYYFVFMPMLLWSVNNCTKLIMGIFMISFWIKLKNIYEKIDDPDLPKKKKYAFGNLPYRRRDEWEKLFSAKKK